MLGVKRSYGRALGSKHDTVDLLGAKMVIHEDKKPAPASQPKREKLEK